MNHYSEIKNRKHKSQIIEFSGLKYGNMYPTDIDCFIDFKDKLFIFAEAKFGDAELPFGQRLALERLCDTCSVIKPSVVFVVRHTSEEDIDIAYALVSEYRYKGEWRYPENPRLTLRQAVDKLVLDIFK